MAFWAKSSGSRREKDSIEVYRQQIIEIFLILGCGRIAVQSELVKAFMKVLSERRNIIKKGSRTGYFSLPHKTVCSRIWATPVESLGTFAGLP